MARLEARLRREGGLARRADRASARRRPMTPHARSFCCWPLAAVYLGTIEAAFSALMRLSLRLMAERGGRDDRLGFYLDDPLQLFVPARLLLGLIVSLATVLIARADRAHRRSRRSACCSLFVAVFVLAVRARAAAADRPPQSRSACSNCCCRRSTSSRGSLQPLTGALVRLHRRAPRRERQRRRRRRRRPTTRPARPRTPTSKPAKSRG